MMQRYKQKNKREKFSLDFLFFADFFHINDIFYHILHDFFEFQQRLLKKN